MSNSLRTQRPTAADGRIAIAIREHRSFLLDAGAGSGKTSSLVRALTLLRTEYRDELLAKRQQVACITYTKVARDEIIERTERDQLLRVSTIHDFLWVIIKSYQTELRKAVHQFNTSLPPNSTRKKDDIDLTEALISIKAITYSDLGSNFLEGRIHHDDLIGIATIMFRKHPFLSKLAGAKYPFIFVDEYQDTFADVVEILLDRIRVYAPHVIVGFFGDKQQAIYDDVVGELNEAHQATLDRIVKEENYRCAIAVINLLNRFRTDIQQVPSGDNASGAAIYVGLSNGGDNGAERGYELAQKHLVEPPQFNQTKVLYLTHRLIARKAGYGDLFAAYNNCGGHLFDQFKSGEEPIVRFLAFELDLLACAWADNDAGTALTILRKNGFTLQSIGHKQAIKAALDELVTLFTGGHTVGKVIAHVANTNLVRLTDLIVEGVALASRDEAAVSEEQRRLWQLIRSLLSVEAVQVRRYRQVFENNMPYSTKHGVKGDEFETVVVVLDDKGAKWYNYSFGKLLEGGDTNQVRHNRTANLFYVCCSRARKNLVVVDFGYNASRKAAVERLFGSDNVFVA